jgi:hypothetical protein
MEPHDIAKNGVASPSHKSMGTLGSVRGDRSNLLREK